MQSASGQDRDRLKAMTDRQLLEAYAGGRDFLAFGAFVERHEGPLLSFAAAFLRDDTLAQDVVQETFLRAAREPQRVLKCQADGATERNWLLKVARDLSVDNLRRRASEKKAVAKLAAGAETSAQPADAAAQDAEESVRVRAAIDRLRPRLRELLILKVSEQKSYKEIAQITGLTVTNVGFLLHEAMQELGKGLGASR
ncbi:MAG: RNA polymerase sigma factor [Planctomycetota bacterium]